MESLPAPNIDHQIMRKMLKNNFGSFLTQFAKISSIYCKMNLLTGNSNGGPNFPELRLIFSFHKTSPRPHYVKLMYFVEIIYFF